MTGLSVAILTPQQRRDLIEALTIALDADPDDAKDARRVELINMIEKES